MLFLFLTVGCVSATTITVGDNSTTNLSFSSIQDAIDHAQKDDSIIIYSGTYSESLTVDKPLSISSFSLDPEDVVLISNNSSAPIIHITVDNVKISGLTIEGASSNPSVVGIFIDHADSSLVSNNIISNTLDGLYIVSSSGSEIQNNTIFLNIEHGVHLLDSTLNNLENNNVQNNKRGLYVDESDQITIEGNNVSNNQMYGIALRKSLFCTIVENELILNNIGLALTSSDKNTVFGNNLNENKQYGLHIWESNSNSVTDNYFAENKDSGLYLTCLSSNNIFERNSFYSNLNGITIESTDDNIIKNNKFRSNEEYAIYHRFPDDKNSIEDNSFADNRAENIKLSLLQAILIVIITLTILTIIAFYFGLSWLKKGLFGLVALIIISAILLLAWYFPFESSLPANNVYVENLEANSIPINETYSRVTLSMNLNYQNKDAYLHTNNTGDMIDNLPVFVQVSVSTPADGSYSDEDTELIHEEQVVLEYLGSNYYECTIDLESGKTYEVLVEVNLKRELEYPHPYYGEVKWELLGVLSDDIDLR
jgi:parallel beta-helix repeat protein